MNQRQRDIISRMTLNRIAKGLEQADMKELDRFFKIPKTVRIKHVYCVVDGCGKELIGAELNSTSGKCFRCKRREKDKRSRRASATEKKREYTSNWKKNKRIKEGKAVGNTRICVNPKCGVVFEKEWPNQTHCTDICSYDHKRDRTKVVYVERKEACA